MTKLFFIVNPNAGKGKAKSIWSVIESKLERDGLDYKAYFTEGKGHGKDLAKKIVSGHYEVQNLVVIGGDGTLNEVINGIENSLSDVRVGFIPSGSGNDFARGFSIPIDPLKAFSLVLEEMSAPSPQFDVGKVTLNETHTHYFINSTGAGFDALISYEANQSNWKHFLNRFSLGQFIYVIILLKNLFTYKCTTVKLNIDGVDRTFPNTWFVTVSNQPFYGGGMQIAPLANPKDKKLNITVVHDLSKWKLLLVFLSVFKGKHIQFKEVETFIARELSVYSSEPIYVHSDGEYLGTTPLQITIHHDPITIMTKEGTLQSLQS